MSQSIGAGKCVNCRNKPKIILRTDQNRYDPRFNWGKYKAVLIHDNPTCPYNFTIYHYNPNACAMDWNRSMKEIKKKRKKIS